MRDLLTRARAIIENPEHKMPETGKMLEGA